MLLDKIDGLKVSLVDEEEIQDFSFGGDRVSATMGTKSGAVCAPILEVEEINESSLVIKDRNCEILWSHIEISDEEIRVIRNGNPCVYRVIGRRSLRPKRRLP